MTACAHQSSGLKQSASEERVGPWTVNKGKKGSVYRFCIQENIMKKITLFCCAGMSTSMLVTKMQQIAKKDGKDYDIAAYSLDDLAKGEGSDVILIGPQVRYALKKVQAAYPDTPVSDIDMRTYGLMDGAGVIKIAEKFFK